MDSEIEFNEQNCLWWPKWEDRQQVHFDYHTKHLKNSDFAIQISNKGTVFQAGGNVGIWPNYFKRFFNKVISAEADPDLYECMKKNCNIDILNCAVGHEIGEVTFYRTGKSGTGTLKPENDGLHEIKVRQITIDSLLLPSLDLLYLDIEGNEANAIIGASETIKEYRPVICVEVFDRNKAEINSVLNNLGYKFIKKFGRDHVYTA